MPMKKNTLKLLVLGFIVLLGISTAAIIPVESAQAATTAVSGGGSSSSTSGSSCTSANSSSTTFCVSGGTVSQKYGCGSDGQSGQGLVLTTINFGCKGNACVQGNSSYGTDPTFCNNYHNGILDLSFAIIRFLSDGVGIVIIGSIIVAGIQYTTSQGDPNATSAAMGRIRSSLIALLIFLFTYAILNYVVPGTLLS